MNESNPSDEALAELMTLTMEVDFNGNIRYRNHLGQMHRIHGPALIICTGSKRWYQNGLLHRTDGPAIEWSHGDKWWFLDDDYLTEQEFNERISTI